MKAGNFLRIGVDVWLGYVERYHPDVRTTSFDALPLSRSQRREVKKAVDVALGSLDEVFNDSSKPCTSTWK